MNMFTLLYHYVNDFQIVHSILFCYSFSLYPYCMLAITTQNLLIVNDFNYGNYTIPYSCM